MQLIFAEKNQHLIFFFVILPPKKLNLYKKIQYFLQNQPRSVVRFLKLFLVVLFGFLLWYDVFRHKQLAEISAQTQTAWQSERWWFIVATILLMPLNWILETRKWLVLVNKFERMNLWRGLRAVLAGVTFSLFFPNRVGEFAGRILFLKSKNSWRGTIATLVSSWAQQFILIAFGFLGFVYFLIRSWHVEQFILDVVIAMGLLLVSLILFLFLNLEAVVPIVRRIGTLKKYPNFVKQVQSLRRYTKKELATTLFWAFARYVIYSFQYYLVLRFFCIEAPFVRAFSCIATIYLLQTSIPLPPVMGLMARGEIALKIWGLFSTNAVGILAATFTLWIINLIIPAFIGLVFILRRRILTSVHHDSVTNKNLVNVGNTIAVDGIHADNK